MPARRFPGPLLPRPRSGPAFRLRTPPRRHGRLGNWAEDNLNLNVIQITITKFNNLLEAFLPDVRLGLAKRQIVALDHRGADRPLPQTVTLDTLLERHIEKKDHAGDMESLGYFQEFPPVRRGERRGINYAKAVQTQAQFREEADKGECLGMITLVPLVVAYAASRPVRRDDLSRAKVPMRKSCFPAGGGSAKQNNRRAEESHPFFLALVWCLFCGHGVDLGSFRD